MLHDAADHKSLLSSDVIAYSPPKALDHSKKEEEKKNMIPRRSLVEMDCLRHKCALQTEL